MTKTVTTEHSVSPTTTFAGDGFEFIKTVTTESGKPVTAYTVRVKDKLYLDYEPASSLVAKLQEVLAVDKDALVDQDTEYGYYNDSTTVTYISWVREPTAAELVRIEEALVIEAARKEDERKAAEARDLKLLEDLKSRRADLFE